MRDTLPKVTRSILVDSMRAQQERREIQGARPAPLKICRASHGIRKPAAADRVQPVIIYTHSPKIIHTEAQDFMTLVQRLTGSSDTRSRTRKSKHSSAPDRRRNSPVQPVDHRGSSSVAAADNYSSSSSSAAAAAANLSSQCTSDVSAISGGLIPPPSPNSLLPPSPNYGLLSPSIFQDLAPFTPNSDNFFYSPRHFYRFSEPIFTPPQRPPHSSLISPSPSALDLYKTLPEYQ